MKGDSSYLVAADRLVAVHGTKFRAPADTGRCEEGGRVDELEGEGEDRRSERVGGLHVKDN